MNKALRIPKADLIREVLKQLGYSRTSTQGEKFVQEGIEVAVMKGMISEDSMGFVEVK
jgi:hypothetical protein